MSWQGSLSRCLIPAINDGIPPFTQPIDRLLHERASQLHATPNLHCKLVKPIRPKRTRAAQSGGGQGWGHSKLVSREQRNCFADNPNSSIELLELAAHKGKATICYDFFDVIVSTEKLSKS